MKHRLEAVTEEAGQKWPHLSERERAASIAAIQEAREELGLCLLPGTDPAEDLEVGACTSLNVKAVEGPNYIDPGCVYRVWLARAAD